MPIMCIRPTYIGVSHDQSRTRVSGLQIDPIWSGMRNRIIWPSGATPEFSANKSGGAGFEFRKFDPDSVELYDRSNEYHKAQYSPQLNPWRTPAVIICIKVLCLAPSTMRADRSITTMK